MKTFEISRIDDPRIRAFTHLTDVDYRLRAEAEHGLFMAEGELVIERALTAGHEPNSALMARTKAEAFCRAFPDFAAPVYVASDEHLAAITGYHVHRGALVAFHRPPPRSVAEVCRDAAFVLVLEDLVDHTNVGAIFRSAAALGCEAVVLSPRCADPLYRRALKVSMGATAMLPWARATSWPSELEHLTTLGFTTIALTPAGDTPIGSLSRCPRPALVVGTEGTGLTAAALNACAVRAAIAMSNDIDSLNVAAASAVACYALRLP